MSNKLSRLAENEIAHGILLANGDPEMLWGWGTPAGRRRAVRRAALLAAGAGLEQGVHALEIGCGTGVFTEMFAETGARITAVDISGDLIRIARARRLPDERVQFVEARFESCSLPGPFDAIVGSSVLHHLDLHSSLTRIMELLKPGKALCFAEPNMLNPQVFAERTFLRSWLAWVSPDETAFIRWKTLGTLRSLGYVDIEITPFDWLHSALPRPLIGTVGKLGLLLERMPVIREFSGSLLIRCVKPLH